MHLTSSYAALMHKHNAQSSEEFVMCAPGAQGSVLPEPPGFGGGAYMFSGGVGELVISCAARAAPCNDNGICVSPGLGILVSDKTTKEVHKDIVM